mgnify:CR=1 FL=1
MDIAKKIAEELKIQVWQVEAVIKLIDEGNTIPFIARYRKEQHGTLNDEQLRNLEERLTYLRNLEERKQTVLANIEEQGKLTAELRKQIEEAQTQVLLEDLYRPYRPKRRTRATIAKEKGFSRKHWRMQAKKSSSSPARKWATGFRPLSLSALPRIRLRNTMPKGVACQRVPWCSMLVVSS